MKKTLVPLILMLIAFTAKAQYIPNGSLEHWHQLTSPIFTYVPDSNWYTLDSELTFIGKAVKPTGVFAEQVYQTNNKHDGALGAKLWTKMQDTLGMCPAGLSNCQDSVSYAQVIAGTHPLDALYFKGGTHVTAAQRPGTVNMWIQYYPNGADTAHIKVNVLNSSGTVIGSVDSMITATLPNWTYVTPHISYLAGPDTSATLQIIISSSYLGSHRGKDSTIMYVDQINYTPAPVGVVETNLQHNTVHFYPNPSTGVVYLYNNGTEKLSWQVFNTSGQVILNKALASANREDLSYLPAGTYFYNVLNDKGQVVQKDKFSIVR
jgi:hypothetical protein